jgi:iron-sulfur cluster assembly accessory protein
MAVEPTKITKYWPISKIIELYPDSVELMIEAGLQCFNCSAANTERLNEGLKLHGFTEDQISEFVDSLNLGLKEFKEKNLKKPTDKDFKVELLNEVNKKYYQIAGIKITDTAYNALHELLDDFKGLQIKLDIGGCSGYTYTYDFKNEPEKDEQTFQLSENLALYLNDFTFDKLYGTLIDFKFGIKDAGLKFINPNIKESCHCGTSVGF